MRYSRWAGYVRPISAVRDRLDNTQKPPFVPLACADSSVSDIDYDS